MFIYVSWDLPFEIWLRFAFYFLRYAQVKNQKAVNMFAYEFEKQDTTYFSRKCKASVNNLRIL